MIKQVQPNYNTLKLEGEIQDYWKENDAYQRTKELRSKEQDFYFVDGPPYTTGAIHLGTATNKAIKDAFIRYKRMNGFNVRDQPGYDMHGLPIEVKVEQSIGVRSKKEIEEYGIDRFVSTCKQYALDLQGKMTEQFKELGIWMDWDNPYMTIKPEFIEAAWWTLQRAHEKGLLISSNRVLPWCPRCETALAEAEIEYWDEKDPSIYVRFPLKDSDDVSLLIWTTTPWTLPANMAVAVHPDHKYAKVQMVGEAQEKIIVMHSQVKTIAEESDYSDYVVLEVMDGEDLVGLEYMPPFIDEVAYPEDVSKWMHRVVPSHTVEVDHTGIVHNATGHGPEDFEIGKKFNIVAFCPVDEVGRYTSQFPTMEGTRVKKANPLLIEMLEFKGLLFNSRTIEHRYGHCWRCRSPIIFRNTDQWFLRITEVKNQMLKEIDRVSWFPEWAGSSREYDWVSNARDWCISRQRYWGIPLPVWRCNCGEMRVIGSYKELSEGDGYHEDMEPHRPWIDQVTFECPRCGGTMIRALDVLDVWFDSGVTSWAQLGYPSRTDEFDRWWPTQWICEAHDQTRGWFYSQLGAGCIAFDRAPYNQVLMHGWVLDPKGKKMSKSKGNVIEPMKVIEQYGADSLRFYMMSANALWEDMAFQHEGPKDARKMLNILWNVVNFATTYMSIDNFDPSTMDQAQMDAAYRPEDRWMLSKTNRLIRTVTEEIETMNFHKACRALEEFILDDVSRWYVRLIRDRMWREEGDVDKLAAYTVLYNAIMVTTKLLAPFCPHITEEIYLHMNGEKVSVHMLDWPTPNLKLIDTKLETTMTTIQEIVETISAERQKQGIKLRWPLKRLAIRGLQPDANRNLESLEGVFLSQANIKGMEYVPSDSEWDELILTVIPNPHAIGNVYRQWSSKIAVLLESRPAKQIKNAVEQGEYYLGIEGQRVKIEPNMVSFAYTIPDGIEVLEFSQGTLYIDFNRTPEIEAEGFARELIRRVQQMRKDLKLDVEEFVRIEVKASARLSEYFKLWRSHIMKETRSRELVFNEVPAGDAVKEWSVEDENLTISVTSLKVEETRKAFEPIGELSDDTVIALSAAGYNSPEDLMGMREDSISAIPGVLIPDAKRIARSVSAANGKPEMGESVRSLPREKMMRFLMGKMDLNEAAAEIIFNANYDSPQKLGMASFHDLIAAEVSSKTAEKVLEYFGKQAPQRPSKTIATIEPSSAYLIMEEKPDNAFRLMKNEVSRGRTGFCVTRSYPLKVRSKYDLTETPMVWLSNVGKDNSIRPKDLEKLSMRLQQFLSEEKEGVVLIEGIEYLITNNSFLTVLKFIQSLRDMVAISGASLLLVVNPSTMEPNELKLLEKEVDGTL